MRKEQIKMKLIVAHAKCSKCGFERTLYFTADNMYGERIVSTKSGKYCAYVNLLEENIMDELEQYCIECFAEKKVNISKNKLSRIISNIYGITCDDIFGEKVDTIPNLKCVNCSVGTMIEDKEYGEQLTEVEMLEVTHDFWKKLDKNVRKKEIVEELVRQRYLEY